MILGIVELYSGASGKKGFYNSQEIGMARAMKSNGYQVYIFYPDSEKKIISDELIEENIYIVYVPAKTIGIHSFYDWNVFLKYNLDVVQIGADNQIFAPSCIKFCLTHNILTYLYIGTVESDSRNFFKQSILKLLMTRNIKTYKRCKCFVKTKYVQEQLFSCGVRNVEIAEVGLDTSIIPTVNGDKNTLRDFLNLPKDKIILLFIGRLESYKRPFDVLHLLRHLTDDVIFVMIGAGSLENQLDDTIRKRRLIDRVIRISSVSNQEIHKYYVAADFFVNFNDHEIFGMSILEAMYHGCTVIAREAPGPCTIIQNKYGYLVQNLAEMKEIVSSNKVIDSYMIKEHVNKSFTWRHSGELIDRWIKSKIK